MRIIFVFIVATLIGGCDAIEKFFGSWDGYVYPDRSNLARSIYIGEYKTLDECRTAALRTLASMEIPLDRGDYECGLNCESRNGFNVCSRTER